MSVQQYYTTLMGLYDELYSLQPLPACECALCTCNVVGKFARLRDEEQFHQFLVGVDDEVYGMVRSNLLSQSPLPDLNRAYQTLLQEERSRSIARGAAIDAEAHAFALQVDRSSGRSDKIDRSKLFCSHCKQKGHDVGMCFKLHGYPDWWEARNRNKGTANSRGSLPAAAPRGGGARANAVSDSLLPPPTPAATFNVNGSGTPSNALSNEQVQVLLNMIKSDSRSTNRMMGECISCDWIIDTGASHHVTRYSTRLIDIAPIPECPVGLPDGRSAIATLEGRVLLSNALILDHVLYVPGLHCHLISVSKLIDHSSCTVTFTNSYCAIQDLHSRNLIGAGERRDGLFYFRDLPTVQAVSVPGLSKFKLWHLRLGHPSDRVVKLVPAVRSSTSRKKLNKACVVCPQAKQTRSCFPLSDNKASRILELIHCDLWGPYKTLSTCDAIYFLTIVDDYSRAVWVYLLRDKKEVHKCFLSFFAVVERQYNALTKIIRSDNGTEFKCLFPYFDEHGIIFQSSCVDTPQQNGRVERKHQHILNVARALMFQANLPIIFWGECVLSAVYLINRTPSGILDGKTPFEVLTGTPPDFDIIRVFGCLCFAHNKRAKGDKFVPRSRRCIFVGYPPGKKGWKLFDIETGEFFVSRDVQFHETEFPFPPTSDMDILPDTVPIDAPILDDLASVLGDDDTPEAPSPDPHVDEPISSSSDDTLGRRKREKRSSILLRDFVTNHVRKLSPSASTPASSGSSGTPYPIAHFVNCDKFSMHHRVFVAAILAGLEPRSYKEAMTDAGWREAMQREIRALEDNHTWVMEPLPNGKKALGCKWVYKIKYHSDGNIERLKARVVIFGNHQVEGLDYNETFAPVAKMITVRAFFVVAAAKNWELHQMDVHNAFLHGDLDEEVFMKLPPGFSPAQPGMVCRLKKSLYGLRQAPRC